MSNGLVNFCWRWGYRVAYVLATVYWFIRRPPRRGAFVVLWHDGEALLVRNSYKFACSLPGGLLRADEDPAVGGVRELAEEVGVQLDPAEVKLHTLCERGRSKTWVFETELAERPEVHIDQREVTWAGWLPASEAAALPLSKELHAYFAAKAAALAPNDEGSA